MKASGFKAAYYVIVASPHRVYMYCTVLYSSQYQHVYSTEARYTSASKQRPSHRQQQTPPRCAMLRRVLLYE